jgi:phosphoribosylformimino-5-aminoimidazole carboxamide ribotide isomerase
MIVIPAVDLLDGKAVRLHQGRYDAVTVYDNDPPARARAWRGKVPFLHVVDLEGARDGRPVQRAVVRAVIEAFGTGVEVGGGVRTRESFEAYLALGSTRVVLGSAAVKDAPLVRALAIEHPGVVILAVDARDGFVAVDGWTQPTRVRAVELVRTFADAPLAGVLYATAHEPGRTSTRRRSWRPRRRSPSSPPEASARSTTSAHWLPAESPRASSGVRFTTEPSRSTTPSTPQSRPIGLRLRSRRLDLGALATPPRGFRLLLAALHAWLHVMTSHLQFAKHSLGRKLSLEHLDGPLDTAVADDDLEGFALNRFAGHLVSGKIV